MTTTTDTFYPITISDASGEYSVTRTSDTLFSATTPEGPQYFAFENGVSANAFWLWWCCR